MTKFEYLPKEWDTDKFRTKIVEAILNKTAVPEIENKLIQLEIAYQLRRMSDALENIKK